MLLLRTLASAAQRACAVTRNNDATATCTYYGCCWSYLATDSSRIYRALGCFLQAQGRPGVAPLASAVSGLAATAVIVAVAVAAGSQAANALLHLPVLLVVGGHACSSRQIRAGGTELTPITLIVGLRALRPEVPALLAVAAHLCTRAAMMLCDSNFGRIRLRNLDDSSRELLLMPVAMLACCSLCTACTCMTAELA